MGLCPRGCIRMDSLRNESNFRIFMTLCFVHPSETTMFSISVRISGMYSGCIASSYNAFVKVYELDMLRYGIVVQSMWCEWTQSSGLGFLHRDVRWCARLPAQIPLT